MRVLHPAHTRAAVSHRCLHLLLKEAHVQVNNLPNTQVSCSQAAADKEAAAATVVGQQGLQVLKVSATIPAVHHVKPGTVAAQSKYSILVPQLPCLSMS